MLRITILRRLLIAVPVAAADWPQYLGPSRNGVYAGAPLNEKWPAAGPRVVWRKQIGAGSQRTRCRAEPRSSCSIASTIARSSNRSTRSPALPSGGTPIPTSYRDDFGFDEGPRAVPVVADGVVYTFGAEGQLHAHRPLDRKAAVERRHDAKQFGVPKGFFGAAGSPLVEDGKVIANVGGKNAGIVAFDAKTGKVIWTATTMPRATRRASPRRFWAGATPLFLTREGLVGLDPATGRCDSSGRGARGRRRR